MQLLAINIVEMFQNLWASSGLAQSAWQNYVMLLVSFVLMYLAIVKKFEPLLLLPIAFGMFLINIPGAQNIVWGRYETPYTLLSLGLNEDGTLEYVATYFNSLLNKTVYIRENFLNGDTVTYFASFEDLKNGISSTMSAADFNAYTVPEI